MQSPWQMNEIETLISNAFVLRTSYMVLDLNGLNVRKTICCFVLEGIFTFLCFQFILIHVIESEFQEEEKMPTYLMENL